MSPIVNTTVENAISAVNALTVTTSATSSYPTSVTSSTTPTTTSTPSALHPLTAGSIVGLLLLFILAVAAMACLGYKTLRGRCQGLFSRPRSPHPNPNVLNGIVLPAHTYPPNALAPPVVVQPAPIDIPLSQIPPVSSPTMPMS